MAKMMYRINKKRFKSRKEAKISTGMRVTAAGRDGVFKQFDIYDLDLPSLKNWLRQRGGKNDWAETAFAISMGHPRKDVIAEWNKKEDGDE